MKKQLSWPVYAALTAALLAAMLICISAGSVAIPVSETWTVLLNRLLGKPVGDSMHSTIILSVRLPRVTCAALVGASLALCGASMQGLLRNPLADGSTLGISSGASLGAALAIMTGFSLPGSAFGGTVIGAVIAAVVSLWIMISLAWALDHSLSTHTIILIGMIFSMAVSSLLSLLITFSGEKLKTITFWTMGSLASSSWQSAGLLAAVLLVCGAVLLGRSGELNVMTLGEEHALHIGVNVRGVKLSVMIVVSCLIGVCVAVGGTIGFVGLVIPHIMRLVMGPDHRKLLPATMFGGSIFLLLADLAARTLFSPRELPIGVVTSLIGAVVFIVVFIRTRKRGESA